MFEGSTYDERQDGARLRAQLLRVWRLMYDEQERSLSEASQATGDPPASISTRFRDFRKPQYSSHKIERRRLPRGLLLYRLVVNRRTGSKDGPVKTQRRRGGDKNG
jgi:hypothetical protein